MKSNTSLAAVPDRGEPGPVLSLTAAFSEAALKARLAVTTMPLPRLGWVAPLLVLVLAGAMRFVNLAYPNAIVFDETYYAKDGYSLLHFGYERSWSDTANESFVAGAPAGIEDSPAYVVHPPVGKWMIALGMAVFGDDNPFGWRAAAALTGTLSVALVMLAGWLIFRSVTVASLAGLFLSIDGLHYVQSRLALLDIFLMFWLLATFVALLLDRYQARRRLATLIADHARSRRGLPSDDFMLYGPWLGVRYWRIIAGVCAGLAVGVKWNALFFIALFGLMTVFWDANARRIAGIKRWYVAGFLRDGIFAFFALIGTGLLTYLATWTGWFLSDSAYDRNWAVEHPGEGVLWLPESLRSLWEYHRSAYAFHSGLDSDHTYESPAWQWLILGRPTSYFYESHTLGVNGCEVEKCSQAILNIGNPLIWWSFIIVAVVSLALLVLRRDWRFGALFAVFAVGYFPWFAYPERTMFFFYALSFEPYLVLMLAGVLGLALGRPGDSVRRRRAGLVVVGAFTVFALLLSVYYWPIWTAEVIPYDAWRARIWFDAWI
ncbi:dolichyl-phosphate-mannose--protein mannosyltransferase [Rothia nasimurium]|uniref:dolichyl-phosphate-mannose--protein mannosyltransferase n=1 Tax=Rothia nasimurium TaxID=85336 RepID=UPI001F01CD9F|nr:phospholipid carrier-dependent glycosyltransferase [Rothia nasimurium]